MDRDYIYRYTDEKYLSKEEIKKVLNLNSVDYIYENVMNYRKLYYKVLDLFSNEHKPFSICLCNGLITRVIKFEKKLMKASFLKTTNSDYLFEERKRILKIMCSLNNLEANDTIIESIINNSLINIPKQYVIIANYNTCLNDIDKTYASKLDENILKRLYSILIYGEIKDIDDIKSLYRVNELSSYYDDNYNFTHFEGAKVERIPLIFDSLFDQINDYHDFPLIEGLLIIFYILYFKPFECFNEEMSILLAKYYFRHEDEDILSLPIENILLTLNDIDVKKVFLECEVNLDLTYFVDKYLQQLSLFVDKEIEDLSHLEDVKITNENLIIDDVKDNSLENKENVKPNVEVTRPFEGITYEKKISMPIIPQGLDENDASSIALDLLELNPTLKKGQAEFYARHCTIGKYYTIQQFKDEQGVAYETARTSMDNLTDLGFYKKEKIRNKFVYTPSIRS